MLADQMKMQSSRVIKSATPDLTLSSKRDLNNGPRLRAGMSGSGLKQASQQCFTMSAFGSKADIAAQRSRAMGSEGSRTRYSDKATVSAVIADPFLFSVRCPDRCAKNACCAGAGEIEDDNASRPNRATGSP